jgi:hypothetical protein
MHITIAPHRLLDPALLQTTWPAPLGDVSGFDDLALRLEPGGGGAVECCPETKTRVRDLLRQGGFKPSGRSKPASEYLLRAQAGGHLGPINPAVDACNIASLHSGLPISVVDLDRTEGALGLGLADAGVRYVFNASGQEIDVGGLLCLHDAQGPCGGPVKDSQRTKTHEATRRCLSIIWGTTALPGRTEQTARWYQALIEQLGGEVVLSLPEVPRDHLG